MFATDLDGTLLNSKHELSDGNRDALKALADKGFVIAVATGRSRSSLPETITSLKGLRYLITANGARVYTRDPEELIYEKYLSEDALAYVAPFFSDSEVMCEAFWDGIPHVEEGRYNAARDYGVPKWFSDYFFNSRKALKDFDAEVAANRNKVENINFVFGDPAVQKRVYSFLEERTDLYELTSSFPFNYEIGGIGVSKAAAVSFIAEREGIARDETLCMGDNHNDVSMIEYAGIGVAVANAVPEALAAADLVTVSSEDSAVASALRTLGILL